jgi:hypothetical protein
MYVADVRESRVVYGVTLVTLAIHRRKSSPSRLSVGVVIEMVSPMDLVYNKRKPRVDSN